MATQNTNNKRWHAVRQQKHKHASLTLVYREELQQWNSKILPLKHFDSEQTINVLHVQKHTVCETKTLDKIGETIFLREHVVLSGFKT